MKLSDIFDYLRQGELRLVSIGGGEQGEIRSQDYPQVIASINLGLSAIFSRFTLKEEKLKLLLQPGTYRYNLKSAFAISNTTSTEPLQYIDDADRPFKDDLAKVLYIKTPDGHEVALNDRSDIWSCHTPSTFVLEVPEKVIDQSPDMPDGFKAGVLEVGYRATLPWLPTVLPVGFDPAQVDVELPPAYLQALLYYVASRVHHPVSLNSEVSQMASFAVKYENECARLESNNLHVNKQESGSKFHERGWV